MFNLWLAVNSTLSGRAFIFVLPTSTACESVSGTSTSPQTGRDLQGRADDGWTLYQGWCVARSH